MQNSREAAFALANVLADHKGGDVVVLDLAPCQAWTDFFIIATATSSAHLRGLARAVDEWAHQVKLPMRNTPRVADDETWVLIDLNDCIVHLMLGDARVFYELEKLWFQALPTSVAMQPGRAVDSAVEGS